MNDLEKAFRGSLNQMFFAEQRLAEMIGRIREFARGEPVQCLLGEQIDQAGYHQTALRSAFDELSLKPESRPCHALAGIVGEVVKTTMDYQGNGALGSALAVCARQITHYRLATYGTLATWAKELNHQGLAESLGNIVGREKQSETKLADSSHQIHSAGMAGAGLRDSKVLFVRQLRSILDAENLLISGLAELKFYSVSPLLKLAFHLHYRQTKKHAERIRTVFEKLNETADRIPCDGVEGIIDDAQVSVLELLGNTALDAALIAGAQQAEHYEIATYSALLPWASQLRLGEEVLSLLQDNLADEIATDKKLSFAGEYLRNPKARKHGTAKKSAEKAEFLKLATHAG